MNSKKDNVIGELNGILRIERKLNTNRPISERKVLTVQELDRIAAAQGVKRRIEYIKRG